MIGRRVGKYQITEELGRGGMGVVCKATQITLNRTVRFACRARVRRASSGRDGTRTRSGGTNG